MFAQRGPTYWLSFRNVGPMGSQPFVDREINKSSADIRLTFHLNTMRNDANLAGLK